MFVTLNLEADPVPTAEQIEWIKDGAKDMSVFPRCKLYTNGEEGTVSMGLKDCKAEDEGDFSCTVTTAKGSATLSFKLFVTVEGGMDFRAMLQKKKVKQKKIVVQKMEWIEPLFDIECQQGKDKQVVMTAKLCVSGMKGKWYQRNETIMADIRSVNIYSLLQHCIALNLTKTHQNRYCLQCLHNFPGLVKMGGRCRRETSTTSSRRGTRTR